MINIKNFLVLFCFFMLLFNDYFSALPFAFFYILLFFILICNYSFLDFRVGFVCLLTVYSIYPSLIFLISDTDTDFIVANNLVDKLGSNTQFHVFIVNHSFILGVFFNIFYERNHFLNNNFKLHINKSKYSHIIFFIISFFLLISLYKLDWKRIQNEYTLEGVSNAFFFSYLLFSYMIYSGRNMSLFQRILILLLLIILLYMGVRQVIFWGIIIYVLDKNFKSGKFFIFNKLNFKYFIYFTLILLFFTISVYFRTYRDHSFVNLLGIDYIYLLNLTLNLFFSETIYTYCNLFQVYDQIQTFEYTLFNFLTDFLVQIIPHSIFPDKYDYLKYNLINPDNILNPFGSWYFVGSIALMTKHPLLLFFFGFMICFLFNNFFKLKLLNYFTLNFRYSTYFVIYTFCFLYNVRSPVIGGYKISFVIITSLILIDLLSRYRCKRF